MLSAITDTLGRKSKMSHPSKTMCFIGVVWITFHVCLSEAHQRTHRERHFLHYKFTALTRADPFPEFSAEAVVDDRRIKHFSDEERVWIVTEDWTEAPGEPSDRKDWFMHQIQTLSNCTDSPCSELHVFQRIIGCELEKRPDGSVNLTVFDEYGFDGEDLIAFNSDTMQWIEKSPNAKRTKVKWDRQTGRNVFIRGYLEDCSHWISTFINTKQNSPDVCLSMSESPADESKLLLTCLATGFYPRDVQMDIRLDGIELQDQTSSEIRPNQDQTFQMRTSVKIKRNHEGSYDCLVIHSSLREPVSVDRVGKCAKREAELRWPFIAVLTATSAVLVFTVIAYYIYLNQWINGKMSTYRDKTGNIVYRIIKPL